MDVRVSGKERRSAAGSLRTFASRKAPGVPSWGPASSWTWNLSTESPAGSLAGSWGRSSVRGGVQCLRDFWPDRSKERLSRPPSAFPLDAEFGLSAELTPRLVQAG